MNWSKARFAKLWLEQSAPANPSYPSDGRPCRPDAITTNEDCRSTRPSHGLVLGDPPNNRHQGKVHCAALTQASGGHLRSQAHELVSEFYVVRERNQVRNARSRNVSRRSIPASAFHLSQCRQSAISGRTRRQREAVPVASVKRVRRECRCARGSAATPTRQSRTPFRRRVGAIKSCSRPT
jgi:hypothetical protein